MQQQRTGYVFHRTLVYCDHAGSFAVAIDITQTYILDSGPRRIALLPTHLHGGSSTCCSGSGSLHVMVGLVQSAWVENNLVRKNSKILFYRLANNTKKKKL